MLSLCALAGCRAAGGPVEVRDRVELTPSAAVDVVVRLQPEHAAQAPRYLSAARATLHDYADRFVPPPFTSIVIVDPSWNEQNADTAGAAVVARTRWIAPARAMEPESAVARAVGGRFWHAVFPCASESWFVDGLNQFTSTPVIESQFAVQQQPPAFAYFEQRFFGSFVPFVWRVPLRNDTVGNDLAAYRANAHADPRAPGSLRDRASLVAKTALALGTLRQWVGAPSWDAVLAEFARSHRGSCVTPDDLRATADRVVGVDLAWFFRQVFESSTVFDYGVERAASAPEETSGLFRTTVVVRRYGDAEFTGTAAPPAGPYESGRGVEVRVTFADGTSRVDYWDGRARWKTFTYEGVSAVRSAEIDPAGVLLLDVNRTNNSQSVTSPTAAAAVKWTGRWWIWLEDLMLAYASLV